MKTLVRRFLLALTGALFLHLAMFAFLTPRLVLAQDAAAPSVMEDDLTGLAKLLLDGIDGKNWGLVVSAVIVLAVLAVRRWGAKLFPALAPFLDRTEVKIALPLLGSVGGALLTSLAAGAPLSLGLVVKAIGVGLGAIGLHSATKNIAEAKKAGAEAAAAITTDEQAANTFRAPPA